MNVVRQPKERRVFNHFLYVSTVLALFLMAMTVIQKQLVFSRAAYAASATLIWFMLFVPMFLAIREELIGESLGYPAPTVSSFISLVSIWNYFGRVFSEFVSEDFLVRYKLPRPLVVTLVLLLSCVGHLLIAFPVPGPVYVASIITGFSFGAQLPLLFAIISELFGLKYYSTLFNCGQLASPLGSYILNVKVTGFLYDWESLKDLAKKGLDRSSVKELTCIGTVLQAVFYHFGFCDILWSFYFVDFSCENA
ncbi:hypothetical protein CJ030_MR0G006018 [Morella rubra]|uniref:Uncharacterized protein n=1 Tax=Morella rubra TaxID=262757 RepID=A0A6A1ULQ7_9ROSI|nr:hypothetical protein CJ030_MR0G006018 [Morella rubra]